MVASLLTEKLAQQSEVDPTQVSFKLILRIGHRLLAVSVALPVATLWRSLRKDVLHDVVHWHVDVVSCGMGWITPTKFS